MAELDPPLPPPRICRHSVWAHTTLATRPNSRLGIAGAVFDDSAVAGPTTGGIDVAAQGGSVVLGFFRLVGIRLFAFSFSQKQLLQGEWER